MSLIIKPALSEDYPIVQNMARFYAYDMSRVCGRHSGWEFPANGLYEAHDYRSYFVEKNRYSFLVFKDKELAGFALINKIGVHPSVDWNIGEFYIVAKFQGQGLGKQVACRLFSDFKGIWNVMAMPDNRPAFLFWQNVITDFSHSNFTQSRENILDPIPHYMDVFEFHSL